MRGKYQYAKRKYLSIFLCSERIINVQINKCCKKTNLICIFMFQILERAIRVLAEEAKLANSKKTLFYHCHAGNKNLLPEAGRESIFQPNNVKLRVYTYSGSTTFPNKTGDIGRINNYCTKNLDFATENGQLITYKSCIQNNMGIRQVSEERRIRGFLLLRSSGLTSPDFSIFIFRFSFSFDVFVE